MLRAALVTPETNAALRVIERLSGKRVANVRMETIPAESLHLEQQTHLRQLANDLPRLWRAATTRAKDRKRMLRRLQLTVRQLANRREDALRGLPQGAIQDVVLVL